MANTNSNAYTVGYAIIMTLLVAVALAAVATGLKPIQDKEEAKEKKKQILSSVMTIKDKSTIDKMYADRIQEMVVDANGKQLSGVKAFDIELKKEFKKKAADRQLPIYIYKKEDGSTNYIMPLHGAGLWDEIWGFIALESDFNTIAGVSFDHKGETPGLGAEITREWFKSQFIKEQFTQNGQYKFDILKGRGNPQAKSSPYAVDGMSGATITGDGVEDMMKKGFESYAGYFKAQK